MEESMTTMTPKSTPAARLPLIFEMETSDPDDFLTLCWLADHPQVDLRAVVVTPGGEDQCRLVRWGLNRCGKPNLPIGALHGMSWWKTDDAKKQRVSAWHYKVYGDEPKTYSTDYVESGPLLVGELLRDPQANFTYLIGSAPKNLGQAHRDYGELRLARLVHQGFFAGDNIVAEEHRLAKFKGRRTCPSFNPGGDPRSALELLASEHIRRRVLVSKNVCHGVRWTPAMRDAFSQKKQQWQRDAWVDDDVQHIPRVRRGIELMLQGLEHYERKGAGPDPIPWEMESEKQGQGKAIHDLVAAAACIDEAVVQLTEVEVYRERGEWGANARAGTRTFISTAFNRDRFIDVLAS